MQFVEDQAHHFAAVAAAERYGEERQVVVAQATQDLDDRFKDWGGLAWPKAIARPVC